MKLQAAVEIGQHCGLTTIAEAVNNILLHSMMLFKYENSQSECDELIKEAKEAGVLFCTDCGSAKGEGNCYICRNFDKFATHVQEDSKAEPLM